MISVFFYCSSPYVGYSIKKADYVNREMIPCNSARKLDFGERGYRIFTASGSYMFFGNIDNKRYLHTRQSKTENYDEQNRRIYNDIAFIGDSKEDFSVLNKIAAYVFFEEEKFYAEIAKMITLLDDGFTVDFEALSEFIKRFDGAVEIVTEDPVAKNIFNDVFLKENNNEVILMVPETTVEYFFKQVDYNFRNNILKTVTSQQKQLLSENLSIKFLKDTEESINDVPIVEEPQPEDLDTDKEKDEEVHESKKFPDYISKTEIDKKIEKVTKEIAHLKKNAENKDAMISELKEKISVLAAQLDEYKEMRTVDKLAIIKNILIAALGVATTVLLTLFIQGQIVGG